MTKTIKLTRGLFAIVDDEDYEHVSKYSWQSKKGNMTWYAKTNVSVYKEGKVTNRYQIKLQNLIIQPPPGMVVDHIDGNGLNNRRSNLRIASPIQNSRNRKISTINTTGYKGVTHIVKSHKYRARIGDGGKVNLGRFDTPEEAAYAYDLAALKMFGDYANTNFKNNSQNYDSLEQNKAIRP